MTDLPATLDAARRLDAEDSLRALRDEFSIPGRRDRSPGIYFCGHSLGLAPRGARRIIDEELDDWDRFAVLGHEHARRPWIRYHEQFTPGLQALTGASAHEVIAMNSLTVNLHLLLASFYRPTRERHRIVIERGAFSSDRHAVVAQITAHGFDPAQSLIEIGPRDGEDLVRDEDIDAILARLGDSVALVLWPGVQFRTGQAFDLRRIAMLAHRAGAIAGFDLAHAIGNLPLSLHDDDADFAVWCSYKYLNAGPGAIGGAFVHERHALDSGTPRLAGWWGHDAATRFRMDPGFVPERGAAGWAVSNPPILAAAPLIASLRLFTTAGITRLREKSLRLTATLEQRVSAFGDEVRLVTPRDPQARGAQLSMRFAGSPERGHRVFERLEALGVIGDWRSPDILRLAPVPLYNTFEEVFAFGDALEQALRAVPR